MMPFERLRKARKKTVGTKQTTKAVQKGLAKVVYIAEDADSHVVDPLIALCQEKGTEIIRVSSMAELGQACGIEVGAASAAIIED
ncbi:L7Ae/L30e/S12e/Gadd45 family ribosomal protein [Calderihabitans maritimus]|uniref:50S ribosomal protein L7AE n=1 Tax=Calderihabitans maritimus TaxID=1246530 RepID=A0A1Z5HXZ5_9FIRM|nr:ribosomal L7Ae/L30e/S12e/Gadd45 family protein [Calderihabitans maritimus]GAW94396.1 50S ribosomal protein L7AE [Calderihabitans maritimus]